ncbi:hypothetical protein DFH09DRAFT_911642, partial [Mycena vulgaris]
LLGPSYNTGFECLKASMLDEAKRWFESVICRFVPGGKERADNVCVWMTSIVAVPHFVSDSETCMHLLA